LAIRGGAAPNVILEAVDDRDFGRAIRLIRRRAGKRQGDVSVTAGVSQSTWSRVESGHARDHTVDTLRKMAAALDARVTLGLQWRGAGLDRLLDERHAALADGATDWLRGLGWTVALEVTYSHFGERGSIDLLAGRADLGACLIVELKTEIVSIEELVRRLDAKARLGGGIQLERAGWRPRRVARLVIVLEGSTNRRRVA
jgi:transcriptional regulator with XRE-family HTH domain